MRHFGDEPLPRSFAGSLLVAHPNMLDPNFRRTVLFISEHEPNKGALGVIINRPLDSARQAGRTAAIAAAIRAGQSAALLGGFVPHEVFPMADGQEKSINLF